MAAYYPVIQAPAGIEHRSNIEIRASKNKECWTADRYILSTIQDWEEEDTRATCAK
jgi:hypothetical protein